MQGLSPCPPEACFLVLCGVGAGGWGVLTATHPRPLPTPDCWRCAPSATPREREGSRMARVLLVGEGATPRSPVAPPPPGLRRGRLLEGRKSSPSPRSALPSRPLPRGERGFQALALRLGFFPSPRSADAESPSPSRGEGEFSNGVR